MFKFTSCFRVLVACVATRGNDCSLPNALSACKRSVSTLLSVHDISRRLAPIICDCAGGKRSVLVREVAAAIPDDLMETICKEHGGLKKCLRTAIEQNGHCSAFVLKSVSGHDALVLAPSSSSSSSSRNPIDSVNPYVHKARQKQQSPPAPPPPPSPPVKEPKLLTRWVSLNVVVRWFRSVSQDENVGEQSEQLVLNLFRGQTESPVAIDGFVNINLLPTKMRHSVESFLSDEQFRNDGTLASTYDSSAVGDFDLYRLSRFLSCSEFRSLSVLHDEHFACCNPLLASPPLLIALAFPNQLELDDLKCPKAIRFVLDTATISRYLGPSPYDSLSIEELHEERSKRKLPLKNIGIRKKILRAIRKKKFPCGTPMLSDAVVAYYLYDLLPPGTWKSLDQVRAMIPSSFAEQIGVLTYRTISQFPELLLVTSGECETSSGCRIRRVEYGEDANHLRATLLPPATELNWLISMARCLPRRFDDKRSTSWSMLAAKVSHNLQSLFPPNVKGRAKAIQRFPDVFVAAEGEERLLINEVALNRRILDMTSSPRD